MGMGATKPGSTLPPQGGKGGGRPMPPQVPAQGGKGTVQPPPGQQVIGFRSPRQGETMSDYNIYGPANPPSNTGIVPAQGGKGNMPLPANYQSQYGNYGFDSGLQSYLDQQNYRSNMDAGTAFQYDPAAQTFTGGTMAGQYNPIPLSVMQQAAAGNRDVLNPYFQSKFPQQPAPQRDLGYGIPPPRPQVSPFQGGFPQRDLGYGNQLPPEVQAQINATRSNPQVSPFQGGFPQRDLGYGNPPPRPTAPVTTTRAPIPTMTRPSSIGAGLAALRDRRGKR